jgi:hypothetical protein
VEPRAAGRGGGSGAAARGRGRAAGVAPRAPGLDEPVRRRA